MSLSYQDCYILLGVDSQASWRDVRRAYKRRVSTWHPDKYPLGSPDHQKANDKFVELSLAYKTLKRFYQENEQLPLEDLIEEDLRADDIDAYQNPKGVYGRAQTYQTPIRQFAKLLMGLCAAGGITVGILAGIEWINTYDTLDYVPQSEVEALVPTPQTQDDLTIPDLQQSTATRQLARDLKRGLPLGNGSVNVGNQLNHQLNRHAPP